MLKAKTDHVYSPATCTEPETCVNCGDKQGSALGHTPGAEATCTTAQKCTRCGATIKAALGHNYSPATCTLPKKCTRCGTTSGSALGHTWVEATCTTAKHCTRCNETERTPLGHNPGAEATCTTAQKCTRCNTVIKAALGHNPGAAATCTTAQTCTRCSTVIKAALGHNAGAEATCTTAQTCTRCNQIIKAALNHAYSPATCTEPKKCTRCGETSGSALGHSEGPAATCTTAQKCTRCGETIKAALGHTEGPAATCTSDQICTKCGTVLKAKTGHSYSSTPTSYNSNANGHTAVYKCQNCSATKTDAQVAHTVDTWNDNGNGTHSGTCTVCNYKVTKAHNYGDDDKCTDCGATQQTECEHNWVIKNNSTEHWEECSKCNVTKDGSIASHNIARWIDNGDGTHSGTCTTCNYKQTFSHSFSGNTCTKCGATQTTVCEHNWVMKNNINEHWEECSKCNITKDGSLGNHNITTWTDNGNGAHEGTCTVCNYKVTKTHNYGDDDKCTDCGATKQTECEHNWVTKNDSTKHWQECSKCGITKDGSTENHQVTTWEDNGDGAHSGLCTVCNYKVTELHSYGDDNKCTDCGATKPEGECEHNWTEDKDEINHWEKCTKCNDIRNKEEHKITTWTDNGDGTHSGTCTVCSYKVTKEHSYGDDDKCTDCGTAKPEETCEHDWKQKNDTQYHWEECTKCKDTRNKEEHKITTWADNRDGTHSGNCTVCSYKITKEHNYGDDDKCTDCGITKPEETCEHDWKQKNDTQYHWEECTKCKDIRNKEEHTVTTWADNRDGTHSGACTVCEYKITESHDYNDDDKCSDCGTTKPEETCEHDWKEKGDNKYHWEECTKCGKIKNKEEHTITKWEDNGDGTHKGTCKKCNQTISRNHEKGSNDKCKECNASMNNNNNSNAEKPLPNTGKKTVIISIIGLTTIFGTSIVGIKKYKDIA